MKHIDSPKFSTPDDTGEITEVSKIDEPKRVSSTSLDVVTDGGINNIINVYNEATPEEKLYWGKWYHHAKEEVQELAAQYNISFPVMAAVVAVLSPGNKWKSNLVAAIRVLENHEKVNSYPRNVILAKKILETGSLALVSGPKVTVFFNSLLDPDLISSQMVLDGHAINIWRGSKVNLKGLKSPSTQERKQMIHDYHEAASQLNVSVQALQAITWYIWKTTKSDTKMMGEENAMGMGMATGFSAPLRIKKKKR